MFIIRRMISAAEKTNPSFAIPIYTGSHTIFGDEQKGYIECYSSGTITFPQAGEVDVFLLNSGLKGASGSSSGYATAKGGAGGKGGSGQTFSAIPVEGSYSLSVAATCTSLTSANKSTGFGNQINQVSTNNGGAGSTSTISGSSGSSTNAKAGSNGVAYPFNENTVNADVDENSIWYKHKLGAGGGGGGTGYTNASNGFNGGTGMAGAGGTFGGGAGGSMSSTGKAATANSGSGGGGGYSSVYLGSSGEYDSPTTKAGGNGGSGIIIIRWGNWAA